jgi:hypothetical protein
MTLTTHRLHLASYQYATKEEEEEERKKEKIPNR